MPGNATAITITAISIAGFSITLAVAMTKSLAVSVASTQALWGPVGIGDASGVPGNATAQAIPGLSICITLSSAPIASAFKSVCLDRWPALLVIAITDACLSKESRKSLKIKIGNFKKYCF